MANRHSEILTAGNLLIVAGLFFLALATPLSLVNAQSLPAPEKEKIEALIERVSSLKDARFIRNGSSYSAEKAAIFLRRKWQANESHVRSAQDFIDKVASFSGTSGKPYLIRFKDGAEIQSKEYLGAALKTIENGRAYGSP
jgi:hypothetical protein